MMLIYSIPLPPCTSLAILRLEFQFGTNKVLEIKDNSQT